MFKHPKMCLPCMIIIRPQPTKWVSNYSNPDHLITVTVINEVMPFSSFRISDPHMRETIIEKTMPTIGEPIIVLEGGV